MTPGEVHLDLERRALALAEAALEQPVHLQAEWVATESSGDEELAARAAELLSEVEVATTLQRDDQRAADPAASGESSGPGFGAGDTFGNYRIEREIGRGGMGVVYLARRADESFDLSVALKVMRPLAGVDSRRFEAERRILARLDHPNVARILDGGTQEETPYLVMELAEGLPIDRYCDQHRLSLDDRIEIFLGVCDGVAHAHRNLVVHRDLKPGNIQVGNQGQPKLLDFGIAKLIEADGDAPTPTLFGHGAMTPEYASPEQVRHQPITVATDVYSLGVILFELLTGARPYSIEDRSPGSLERLICETRPPSPSSKAKERTDADLSGFRQLTSERLARELKGDLDTIVLTALGKEQEDRYPTVAALADDLRRYQKGLPIEARPHDWAYVASRFVRRNRLQVGLVSIASALVLAGATVAVLQSTRAARAGKEAEVQAEHAVEARDFLSDMLSVPDPIFGEGKDASVADLLRVASERLGELSPKTRASVAATLGETYYNLGLAESARELLISEIEVSRASVGPEQAETLLLEFILSKVLGDVGDSELALEILERIAPVMALNSPDYAAVAYGDLATVHTIMGNFAEAEANHLRSIDLHEDPEVGSPDHLASLNNLGVLYADNQMYEESEAILRKGLFFRRASSSDSVFTRAQLVTNLAGTISLARPGDPEADVLYAEGIALFDENLGAEHPITINSRAQLTNRLWQNGHLDEALQISAPNLRTAEDSLPEEHMQLGFARVVHAGVLVDLGRAGEIYDTILPVVESRRQALPEGHFLIASAEVLLGASLVAQGRDSEAALLLEGAHAVLQEQRGDEYAKTRQAVQLLEKLRARSVN